jgi:hypothetical protein
MLCPILWAGSVGWQDILALYGTSWDGKDWTNHFQDDFFILTHSWGAWCSLVSCLPGILPSTASPWGMGFSQHGNPSIDTLLQQLVPKKEMELTRSAKAHPELTVIPLYSVDNWVKRMGALYFRISEGGVGMANSGWEIILVTFGTYDNFEFQNPITCASQQVTFYFF